MVGSKNLRRQQTEDQKAGNYTSSAELQECCHSFTHTHAASEQGLDQTRCRGPFQQKLLHDSVNARVTKHRQGFQTLQSSKYSWSQLPGVPVTDVEIHTVNLGQKRKTGLVRDLAH